MPSCKASRIALHRHSFTSYVVLQLQLKNALGFSEALDATHIQPSLSTHIARMRSANASKIERTALAVHTCHCDATARVSLRLLLTDAAARSEACSSRATAQRV